MLPEMKIKQQCTVCETKIWRPAGLKLKKTAEYNEITVRLNDLSNMTVGVCSKHTKPNKLERQIIMQKTKQGWMEEVAFGIGNEDWTKEKGLNLEIVGMA